LKIGKSTLRARPFVYSIGPGFSGNGEDVLAFPALPAGSGDHRSRGASTIVNASFHEAGAGAERFRAMVRAHFDFVWRSLRRLGISGADTDDAAQEVFMIACRRLDDVQPDRERSFLFGTSVRVAATRRRSTRRRAEDPEADFDELAAADLDPEQISALASARGVLQRILDGMSDELRTVFILAELEELPIHEMAELLGIPTGTVSSRLRSAREAFRSAVSRHAAQQRFRGVG
jgi:RNA polymerase sigma-70 factor, ECF subfamily